MTHPERYARINILSFNKRSRGRLSNERGMVLVVGLLLIVVLILLGTTAVLTSTTDMKISANYKSGNEAFFAAEAGIEEARARLRGNAASPITDNHHTSAEWRAYIGTDVKAQGKGYNSGNLMHLRVPSRQSALDYTIVITHLTNSAGQILYFGDQNGDGLPERTTQSINPTTGISNPNIYLETSYGTAGGATKEIRAEITRVPPVTAPAALYVEAPTNMIGNAGVFGSDQCGIPNETPNNLPGIATTMSADQVDVSNNSNITGSYPLGAEDGDPPSILPGAANLDVQGIIDSLKGSADFTYNVASATHTGTTIPGPGDGWGTPTPGATNESASSCSVSNIVYYNTSNGTNFTDIKLTNSNGCGILLVEGDLDVNGGFYWYGLVIVSGSVKYTGGAGDSKNVTGAVIAGGSATADVIGGNTNIVYCSSAIKNQTENQPLRRLSWKDQNM